MLKYFNSAPLFWKMEGSKRNNVGWTVQSWNTEHQFPWTYPAKMSRMHDIVNTVLKMLFLHPSQHLVSAVPVWFCANQDTLHTSAGTGEETEGILGFSETSVHPGPVGRRGQRLFLWNQLRSHPPVQYFNKNTNNIWIKWKQSINNKSHNALLCGQYLDEDTSVALSAPSSSPSPMMNVVGPLVDLLTLTQPCSSWRSRNTRMCPHRVCRKEVMSISCSDSSQ